MFQIEVYGKGPLQRLGPQRLAEVVCDKAALVEARSSSMDTLLALRAAKHTLAFGEAHRGDVKHVLCAPRGEASAI